MCTYHARMVYVDAVYLDFYCVYYVLQPESNKILAHFPLLFPITAGGSLVSGVIHISRYLRFNVVF
jgi:hypothetical protein